MLKFSFVKKEKIADLPTISGVYSFNKRADFLYIGKAVNIKERVQNHFRQPDFKDNIFIPETEKIGFIATNSEIEALILEAELIKKFQPKYNTQWKDGKNYYFLAITNEKFPRVFISHQLQNANHKLLTNIGLFVDGKILKETLRILRKVFPYRTCRVLPKKPCLYEELGLCLAPCNLKAKGEKLKIKIQSLEFQKECQKNIKNLRQVLRGRKMQVLKKIRKEMQTASQKEDFEKAKLLKNQIWDLEKVFENARVLETSQSQSPAWQKTEKKLQKLLRIKTKITRIEGYDISNIQGQEASGGLAVFNNGQPDKNEYRKFKIKIDGKPNDTAMLKETIQRRLKHKEWLKPQLVLIDGGKAQLNAAIAALKSKILNPKSETISNLQNAKFKTIKIISLAKKNNELFVEGRQKPILLKNLPPEVANLILHIRNEAHRFAITYHRKLRSKSQLT